MEVTFVRHGQSEANAGQSESPDSALTEIGQRQSEAAAARLKGEGFAPNGSCYMLVSPLLRTLMTSAPIYAATQMPAELFPDVCEFFSHRHPEKYSRFTGLTVAQIERRFPFVSIDASSTCTDCWWPQALESDAILYSRAERVRDMMLARFTQSEDRVVIVSHADPIARLIEAFLRQSPAPRGPDPGGPGWTDNGGISRVRVVAPDRPAELLLLNDTSHLTSLGISTPV
jgi:broad specificity phosphatase PhoE